MTPILTSLALAGILSLGAGPECGEQGAVVGCATWQEQVHRQANEFTSSTQDRVGLAVSPSGDRIMQIWQSRRQERGSYGIFGRIFDGSGRALGGELRINETWHNHQVNPAVALGNDGAWCVWQSFGQDGSSSGIFARKFEADFASATPEIPVNEHTRGQQSSPTVAVNSAGSALVVWMNDTTIGATASADVRGRLFNADGTPAGAEFALSQPAEVVSDALPTVEARPDGSFLVAWSRSRGPEHAHGIIARIVESDGSSISDEMVLSEGTKLHVEPSIAVDADGGFVAAWMTPGEFGYDVATARFAADGSRLGGVVTVARSEAEGAWLAGAAVAVEAESGRTLLAWNRSVDVQGSVESQVLAQVIDADGLPVGDAIVLGPQTEARVALTIGSNARRLAWVNGRIAAAWEGPGSEGDSSAVNLTLAGDLPESDETLEIAEFASAFASADFSTVDAPIPPIYNPEFQQQEPWTGGGISEVRFGFEAVPGTGWTPPDPELAVGPNHVVVIVNGQIAFFTREGVNTFRDEIENSFGFWGSLGADNFVFDPEALWDPHTERFWVMACERSDDNRSYFLLAVSDDSDPNGTWFKYRLDVTGISDNDIDSPNMAVDDERVYLTADFFGPDKYLVYMIEKAPLLTGGTVNDGHILITGTQSYGIPVTYDADAPAQYMLQSTESSSNNTVIFHAIQGTLGAPTHETYTLSVPTYTYPSTVPQQGTSSRFFLFEPRFWSCMVRNGSLWAVHHQNSSKATVRWYEFEMNGWPDSGDNPTLKQWGDINPGAGIYTFFPSIFADDEGNAGITFARSATNEFTSMWSALRASTDPLGEFREPELVRDSSGTHTGFGRWGDYSGTQNDPVVPGCFWGHHEWTTGGDWRTWVGQFCFDDAGGDFTLASEPLVCQSQADVVATGATPNETVYFGYSLVGEGATFVPFLNVTVGLDSPQLGGTDVADGSGNAVLTVNVPNAPDGKDVWMQAAQFGRVSNIVAAQISCP